jgi:hypothetical protein
MLTFQTRDSGNKIEGYSIKKQIKKIMKLNLQLTLKKTNKKNLQNSIPSQRSVERLNEKIIILKRT